MPFTIADVEKHTKKATTDDLKAQWVAVANSALEGCIEDDGDDESCAPRAIQQANGVIARMARENEAMPLNEYACRIRPPDDFQDGSMRRITRGAKTGPGPRDGKQLSIIIGRLTGESATTAQAYRYKKDDWTEAQARQHCQEQDGTFEEVAEGDIENLDDYIATAEEYYRLTSKFSESAAALDAIFEEFTGSPRNPYGTHASKGYPGGRNAWLKAWRIHLSKADSGALRGTIRRIGMIGATMKCDMPAMSADDVGPRSGPSGRLAGEYKEKPSDYGLSSWKSPSDDELTAEDVQFTCQDLQDIKKIVLQEIAKRQQEAENEESEIMSEDANLAEVSFGYAVDFVERESPNGAAYIDLVPLRPGWGNRKDNHYYPHDVVRESASVWLGAKMWATDHRQEDKNALNQISEVVQAPAGYTKDGVPFVRAVILSPEFEEVVRRRKRAGILDNLHCSILASGTVRKKEFEENGRKGKYVESISPDGAGIDWVTKAGAGGHATAFSEGGIMKVKGEKVEEVKEVQEVELREGDKGQEARPEEKAKKSLAEAEVKDTLARSNLPGASQQRLAEASYQDAEALETVIKAEKAYVKELTGSGKPVGMGGTKSIEELSPEEAEEKQKARFNRIMREVGAKEV